MKGKTSDKMEKARVLIASADAGLRRRLALCLQGAFEIHEVSEEASLERSMTECKPAVLLLDLDLPQLGEVKAVSPIGHLCPSTRIILFTNGQDEKEAISALKAGARGYCTKGIEPSHLRKAIHVVQKGEVWVGRKTICHLLEELISCTENGANDSPLEEVYLRHLTPREHQIALLVGSGECNKEISNRLNISVRTVKAHLTDIFHKLQITDRLRLGLFVAAQNHAKHTRPLQSNAYQTKVQSDQSPIDWLNESA